MGSLFKKKDVHVVIKNMIKRQIIIMIAKRETIQIMKFCVKNTHPYRLSKFVSIKLLIRLALKKSQKY